MKIEEFIILRNPRDGFIVGTKGLKINDYHEDANGELIYIVERTGEYFFDGSTNVEWFKISRPYYKCLDLRDT